MYKLLFIIFFSYIIESTPGKEVSRVCFDNHLQKYCSSNTKACYFYKNPDSKIDEKYNDEEKGFLNIKWTNSKISSAVGALTFTVVIYLGVIYFVIIQK